MTETRKITLQFPSLRAFLAEYAERMSADGMLLRSEAPPAAGSAVSIEVVVAEGMRLLRARGETLWSGPSGVAGGPQVAAIRFDQLDEASRTLIERIVDQRRREGGEPFALADVPGPREARLRDLTVPAAATEAAQPGGGAGSVFDLAEPPAVAPELLAPSGPRPTPPASGPVGESPRHSPQPPVPLFADAEPAPFDLEPVAAPESLELAADGIARRPEAESASPEADGPGERPAEPPPGLDGQSAAAGEDDLSSLFGGDEPQMPPARGRTEAFPPSFVDEVEAELLAADGADSSYMEVDTGVLELPLGRSAAAAPSGAKSAEERLGEDDPAPAPARIEPSRRPPVEAAASIPGDEATASPPSDEAAAPPPADEAAAPTPADEAAAPAPADEAVAPARADDAAAPTPADDALTASRTADAVAAEEEPLPEAPALSEQAALGPELPGGTAAGSEPTTVVGPAAANEPPAAPPPAAAPPPVLPPARPPAPTLDGERGPETVEIPLFEPSPGAYVDPGPKQPFAAGEDADAGAPPSPGGPPPIDEALPAGEAAAAAPPAPSKPPAPAAPAVTPALPSLEEDNLLSMPELSLDPDSDAASVAPAPMIPPATTASDVEMPSSAQSLRGAASRSRHLGTWLLIALLAGALAVAGFFMLRLVRGSGTTSPAEPRPARAAPRRTVAEAPAKAGETTTDDGPATAPEEEAAPPVAAAPAGEAVEEPPATEAPAAALEPLTGLDRITWSETGGETTLTLVADGEISREDVELMPIGGNQPRLIIKISGVQRAFRPAVLEVGTEQVQRVRTGLHPGEQLHVVIDLAGPGISVRDLVPGGQRLEVRLATE